MREQEHRSPRLDDVFASAVPFSLMAALQDGADLEFDTLRRILRAERAPLSGAILLLENEGYVAVRRAFFGEEPGTWVAATAVGAATFRAHLAALRTIAASEPAAR